MRMKNVAKCNILRHSVCLKSIVYIREQIRNLIEAVGWKRIPLCLMIRHGLFHLMRKIN